MPSVPEGAVLPHRARTSSSILHTQPRELPSSSRRASINRAIEERSRMQKDTVNLEIKNLGLILAMKK